MTPNKVKAIQYASEYKDPITVSARILCKNPKIFQNGTDFYDFFSEYKIPVNESEAGFASRLLASQGYDSSLLQRGYANEIRGIQTLVIILNPQQVAVYENESRTSDRLYGSKHNNFDGGCVAFPDEIPFYFASGQGHHTKRMPDQDNDIVFEWIGRVEQRARMKKIVAVRQAQKRVAA